MGKSLFVALQWAELQWSKQKINVCFEFRRCVIFISCKMLWHTITVCVCESVCQDVCVWVCINTLLAWLSNWVHYYPLPGIPRWRLLLETLWPSSSSLLHELSFFITGDSPSHLHDWVPSRGPFVVWAMHNMSVMTVIIVLVKIKIHCSLALFFDW